MKILKHLLLAVVFVSFVSCSEEDDPAINNNGVVGEWFLEELTYSGTFTETYGGESYTMESSGRMLEGEWRVVLNEDGTYLSEGSYIVEIVSTALGQSQTDVMRIPTVSSTGTYRIEDNKFITSSPMMENFSGPGNVQDIGINEASIVELTDTRFVISYEHHETAEEDGVTRELTVQGIQVFIR